MNIDTELTTQVATEAQRSDAERAPRSDVPVLVIEPTNGWRALDVRELWRFRELLYFLTWRDVKVRYKQTVIGAAWAILQPVMTMIVFSVIFGRFAGVPSDGIPYPVFSYTGLLPWTFLSTSISGASASYSSNESLVKKVYFPRSVLPAAAVLAPSRQTSAQTNVTPAQWLALQRAPNFKPGHRLALLSKFSWPFPVDLRVELARNWGYALEFNGYGELINGGLEKDLANPKSVPAQMLAICSSNPGAFKLQVDLDRSWPTNLSRGFWVTKDRKSVV